MAAAVAVGVGLAHASWAVIGPLLDGRSVVLQGTVGAVCGAVAAAPVLRLLSPERRRTAMAPTLWWLLAAAVCFLWAVPFRRGTVEGGADFQAPADSYVVLSVLVFLVTAVVVLRRVPEEDFRPMHRWLEGEPPADERTLRPGR